MFFCSHLLAAIESTADRKLFEKFIEVLGLSINSFRVINPSFFERIDEEYVPFYSLAWCP